MTQDEVEPPLSLSALNRLIREYRGRGMHPDKIKRFVRERGLPAVRDTTNDSEPLRFRWSEVRAWLDRQYPRAFSEAEIAQLKATRRRR